MKQVGIAGEILAVENSVACINRLRHALHSHFKCLLSQSNDHSSPDSLTSILKERTLDIVTAYEQLSKALSVSPVLKAVSGRPEPQCFIFQEEAVAGIKESSMICTNEAESHSPDAQEFTACANKMLAKLKGEVESMSPDMINITLFDESDTNIGGFEVLLELW